MAENSTRKLTWAEFTTGFKKYDADESGFIEDSELDKFLDDLEKVVGDEGLPKDDFKAKIMEQDVNKDGKLSYLELASVVLVDSENFLKQFKNEKDGIEFVDFIKIWKNYDLDRSGYLGENELEAFYLDLVTMSTGKDRDEDLCTIIKAFVKATLENFGGEDKQISIQELAGLLPVKNNVSSGLKRMAEGNFEETFSNYDKDQSGCIDVAELSSLLNDMGLTDEKKKDNLSELFTQLDENKDGKIQKAELQLLFKK